jgi:AraC-like DNA-binding protein
MSALLARTDLHANSAYGPLRDRVVLVSVTPPSDALRSIARHVHWSPKQASVREGLLRFDPAIIVLDFDAVTRSDAEEMVRLSRAALPDATVVAYCRPSSGTSLAIAAAGRIGIDALVFKDRMDLGAELRELATKHLSCGPRGDRLGYLLPSLHPLAAEIAKIVSANPRAYQTVNQIAAGLHCSPRTLQRRFSAAHLSSPAHLIFLLRWLMIVSLRSPDRGRSNRVSSDGGFPSTQAFRKALRRALHVGVRELQTSGIRDRLVQRLVSMFGESHTEWEPVSQVVHDMSHNGSSSLVRPIAHWDRSRPAQLATAVPLCNEEERR